MVERTVGLSVELLVPTIAEQLVDLRVVALLLPLENLKAKTEAYVSESIEHTLP